MAKIIFLFYILIGRVIPMDEQVGSRKTYVLNFKDGTCVEYAYRQEILEYIESGTFEYDDTLDELHLNK